jgi:hypothetical protein
MQPSQSLMVDDWLNPVVLGVIGSSLNNGMHVLPCSPCRSSLHHQQTTYLAPIPERRLSSLASITVELGNSNDAVSSLQSSTKTTKKQMVRRAVCVLCHWLSLTPRTSDIIMRTEGITAPGGFPGQPQHNFMQVDISTRSALFTCREWSSLPIPAPLLTFLSSLRSACTVGGLLIYPSPSTSRSSSPYLALQVLFIGHETLPLL